MKESKTWLILGADVGLGPAAVKYLQANMQAVIPVDLADQPFRPEVLAAAAGMYGPLDFIINNSNYCLFGKETPDVGHSIEVTATLLSDLVPYVRHRPRGCIINIPPQLCVSFAANKEKGAELLEDLALFLDGLRSKLQDLDCNLHFLEPGERLVQL